MYASNNWVISGKYTENGKPLLSSDPHLGNGMPSLYLIQSIKIENEKKSDYMTGAALAGLPTIIFGRTQNISWGMTAAVSDTSDLFKETIDEEG